MKNPTRKIGKISEYARNNEYTKLNDVLIALETVKLTSKEERLLSEEKEKVYNILRFELKRSIGLGKILEKIKIDVLLRMNNENVEEAKKFIRNSTLRRYILEFQSKNMVLKSLDKVKNAFDSFIDLFEKVKFYYSRLPREWNFEGEFLFYSVLHIKEILFESFIGTWNEREYIFAMKHIIDFERKYTKFYFKKDCCKSAHERVKEAMNLQDEEVHSENHNSTSTELIKYDKKCAHIPQNLILFDKDQVLTGKLNIKTNFIVLYHKNTKSFTDFCKHKKMLSHLLLANIEIYINYLFNDVRRIKFCQKTVEMNILRTFIVFFSEVGGVLVQIQHFEDSNAFSIFLRIFDDLLIKMLDMIEIPKKYKSLLILLNTINFIDHTTADLLEKTGKYTEYIHKSKKKTRYLENMTSVQIEKLLKNVFRRRITEKIGFSQSFIQLLKDEVFSLDKIEFDESIFNFLIETLISFQFNRIVNMKMNLSRAEQLITEVIEIKSFFKEHSKKVQLADLMENYLKIFICSTEEPKAFVTCFNHLNQGIFSFQNIIDALEDTSRNNILLKEYTNQSNKIVRYRVNQ